MSFDVLLMGAFLAVAVFLVGVVMGMIFAAFWS